MSDTIRLNKYLAERLGISRRAADELIEDGTVTINGKQALLGSQITAIDTVMAQGKQVEKTASYMYLLLHKPIGYVCSRKRQGNAPTVYELLPDKYHELKLVGRLDKDSSGLILLTNDGTFAHHMTHPSYYKTKVYEIVLERDLEPLHQQMINDYGVQLDDGPSKFHLERLSDTERTSWRITMHEGRNRQIRRTFAALGYTVTALHRTQFGEYSLSQLGEKAYLKL